MSMRIGLEISAEGCGYSFLPSSKRTTGSEDIISRWCQCFFPRSGLSNLACYMASYSGAKI